MATKFTRTQREAMAEARKVLGNAGDVMNIDPMDFNTIAPIATPEIMEVKGNDR